MVNLNISAAITILDTTKLQLAARIDLFDYSAITKKAIKYISFIKGRAGRMVSDFLP